MAERYAEEAHRAYVFACIAAATFGSKVIETEHLLLGILREDMAFVNRFMIPEVSVDTIRHLIQARVTVREMIPATSDISLGDEGNRVYSFAAEEAHLMGREQIGIEHLLLGLLREKNCLAAQLLHAQGRLEIPQAQFQAPAPGIQRHQFLCRVEFAIQQGGHQRDPAVAKSPDRGGEAEDAHGDLGRQPIPLVG